MMLDAKTKVEAQFIAGRQLTPKLLVALRGGHAGFVPDMGEVGELHGDRYRLFGLA